MSAFPILPFDPYASPTFAASVRRKLRATSTTVRMPCTHGMPTLTDARARQRRRRVTYAASRDAH